MVGVGEYPRSKARFPGSHGTPFIYLMVPRVILYREEHSRRVLVPKVDFISAAGVTPPGVYRRGGPTDLITSKAHFTFDRQEGRFTLASVHPGHSVEEIVENTGFDFDQPPTFRRHLRRRRIGCFGCMARCARRSQRPIRSSRQPGLAAHDATDLAAFAGTHRAQRNEGVHR